MECIPQSDDCALEVITKVQSVATVALNAATSGVFGQLSTASAAVQQGVKCGQKLFTVVNDIVKYAEDLRTNFPNGTGQEIISLLNNSNIVVKDLPTAVCVCLGLDVPTDYLNLASDVVKVVNKVLTQQLTINHNLIMSSTDSFLKFFRNTTMGNVTRDLDAETVTNLTALIDSKSTCGFELKRLTDRVIIKVGDMREANPAATNEDLRTEMSHSSLVLNDVPTVTNKCMGELLTKKKPYAAYQTRDVLRKTFGVIIDQLIDKSTTDMGVAMAKEDYWVATANFGFLGLSAIDPSGIAYMMFNFVQPVCGPTEFIGEVDDGSATDALGLTTRDDAFRGSEGTWTKKGDGKVILKFVSTDDKDVKVIIHSAGKKFASLQVRSGETVIWCSTVKKLQDKTMYLDRWRPGFLGLPGSGGGSLLLWIPRSSEGGHLEMTVKINKS
eukprot:jgi/Phyca11/564509/estExt2_Genewise1.C_PHYCAscaffold_150132